VELGNELQKKLELKLAPPVKSVAALCCEMQVFSCALHS